MMYSLTRLNTFTAQNYKTVIFPHLQPLLRNLSSDDSLVAIGAACSDQPVGLILAEVWPEEHDEYSAEVRSIFVAASHRCSGIGTALLTAMEDELRQRGCRSVILVYPTGKPTTPALERLQQKCQWSPPQPRMLVCQTTPKKMMDAPWMYRHSLPTSFSTFLWSELTKDEKRIIQRQQQAERWYPEALSPFQDEEFIEPLNSLGLRYQEEVVGWMITHRYAPDTIRYTALFVRQEFHKMGRAIPLLAEAIYLQNSSKIPLGIFVIDLENEPMCRFMRRRMSPYIISITETRSSVKLLRANTLVPLAQSA